MAGATGFKVEGADAVARALFDLSRDVEDLQGAFGEIASTGEHAAAGFAPRRSGALAGGIRGTKGKKNEAEVTARIRYAGPINYGWPRRNIQAARFMQKAEDLWESQASGVIEKDINRKIKSKGLT